MSSTPTKTKRRASVPKKIRPGARREERPGATLTCLVIASGASEWAAVDLSSGALVRNSVAPDEQRVLETTTKLDVVRFALADEREPFDPARPEAVAMNDAPEMLRKLRRRKTRRLLRLICAPEHPNTPILCLRGPSIAYVDLDGAAPSIVVVRTTAKGLELMTRPDDAVVCAMAWSGTTQLLPVIDPDLCEVVRENAPRALGGSALADAIGFKPGFAVIGLAAPTNGHAKKVILSLLAR